MRFVLPLTLLLATLASAAPVPVDKAAEKQQLEALWKDLETYDPVVRTRAVFALLDHPRAVEFLASKMQPLNASANQLKAWLKDLNSDEEKLWKPAFEELRYNDPRTGLTLPEQIELATTDAGRVRLVGLWRGELATLGSDVDRTQLFLTPGEASGQKVTFLQVYRPRVPNGARVDSSEVWAGPVADIAPTRWRQVAIAAPILRRIDTKASRTVLDRLATGHKDALPTRTAVGLLKATAAPASSDAEFRKGWDGLLSGEPIPATQWALSLGDRPDNVKRMAGVLPAIKAAPDDVKGWLKALDDKDPKVWKPAFEKMLYFRPLLAVPIDAQCKMVATDHGRSALFHLTRWAPNVPDKIDVREGSTLNIVDGRVELHYPDGRRGEIESVPVAPLEQMTPTLWQRARLAVVVLERVGTLDAVTALKQLADGHPDILPTKEAKAALERLKK